MSIPSERHSFKYVFFLPLHPRVLKNSKQIIPVGGRHIPIPSKAAKRFMNAAAKRFRAIGVPDSPIDCPVNVRMVFYGPWEEGNSIPDLSNLYQAVEDVMQDEKVGILEDDMLVAGHDGSRRVRLCMHCPRRDILTRGPRKGMRKDNCGKKGECPFLGVRVEITPFVGDEEERLLAMERYEGDAPSVSL